MTYTGTMIADLIELAESAAKMNRRCFCGANYGEHRGVDATCPHPDRKELGQPMWIEGQFFDWDAADIRRSQGISDFALHQHTSGGNWNG